MKRLLILSILSVLAVTVHAVQQQERRSDAELVNMVPEAVRDAATRFIDRALSEDSRLDLLEELIDHGPTTSPFLIQVLPGEPSVAVRSMVIGAVDFRTSADAAAAVAQHAQNDPSPDVRRIATARLRWEQVAALKRGARALRELAAASRAAGAREVALETEATRRATAAVAALGLPPPPALFSVTNSTPVRVLVLGDFGTDKSGKSDSQEQVAALIAAFHKVAPFGFGITVGDNFYRTGLPNTKDARWVTDWEKPYAPLGIKFWAVAGNHDWDGTTEAVRAAIDYTAVSPSKSWNMPSTYYTFTAGPIQFFALDTDEMWDGVKDEQLDWLEQVAAQTTSKWRIAFGHHPVLTGGEGHGAAQVGGEDSEIRTLREQVLLPVLRKTSDVYVAGHDHELQLLDLKGILQVVAGGAGKASDRVVKLPESVFCAQAFGFAALEASGEELAIRFARLGDKPGQYSYSCTLTRNASGTMTHACQTRCPI